MANERFIRDSISVPRILLGTQAISREMVYDPGTDSIKVIGNFTVDGNFTQKSTTVVNTNIQDNVITLNAGQTGSSISLGESGFEIDRGTSPKATLKFIESSAAWVAAYDGGAGIKVLSNISIADIDAASNKVLTTREYVTTKISQAVSNIDLDDLTDVTITAPTNTQILRYNGSQWVNVPAPPQGITDFILNSDGGVVSERWNGSAWVYDEFSSGGGQGGQNTYGANFNTITGGRLRLSLPLRLAANSQTVTMPTITVNRQGIVTALTPANYFGIMAGNSGSVAPSTPNATFGVKGAAGHVTTAISGNDVLISLPSQSVAAGTLFDRPRLTVDAQGRVVFIDNNAAGGGITINSNSGSISNQQTINVYGANTSRITTSTFGSNTLYVDLAAIPGTGVPSSNTSFPVVSVDTYGRVTSIYNGNPGIVRSVVSSSGTYTAGDPNGAIAVVGTNGITTSISGNTLTLNAGGISAIQASSFASTGYAKFAGNLLIQWGRFTGTGNVFFALAFTTILGVTTSNCVKTDGDSVPHTNGTRSVTNTGFNVYGRVADSPLFYIAIGYIAS